MKRDTILTIKLPRGERGGLALHAGCKVIPVGGRNRGVLIVGLSGTGKTTTTFTTQLGSKPAQDDFIALMPGATDTEIWNTLWPDAPRQKMMSPDTVARALVSALLLPEKSTVEELRILPTSGAL